MGTKLTRAEKKKKKSNLTLEEQSLDRLFIKSASQPQTLVCNDKGDWLSFDLVSLGGPTTAIMLMELGHIQENRQNNAGKLLDILPNRQITEATLTLLLFWPMKRWGINIAFALNQEIGYTVASVESVCQILKYYSDKQHQD